MTSMLKRVDTAVFDFVDDFGKDKFTAGMQVFDLKKDGVGYSTSGGFVDDIKAKLDDYKAKIVGGTITVPTKPVTDTLRRRSCWIVTAGDPWP